MQAIKKSEILLRCQSLLPIVHADEHFTYFADDKRHQRFFSSLITSSDFCRVMSFMQQLALKKQPLSYICHLRRQHSPSLLVLVNAHYQDGCLAVTLYDLATLDQESLKALTYRRLHASDKQLLEEAKYV